MVVTPSTGASKDLEAGGTPGDSPALASESPLAALLFTHRMARTHTRVERSSIDQELVELTMQNVLNDPFDPVAAVRDIGADSKTLHAELHTDMQALGGMCWRPRFILDGVVLLLIGLAWAIAASIALLPGMAVIVVCAIAFGPIAVPFGQYLVLCLIAPSCPCWIEAFHSCCKAPCHLRREWRAGSTGDALTRALASALAPSSSPEVVGESCERLLALLTSAPGDSRAYAFAIAPACIAALRILLGPHGASSVRVVVAACCLLQHASAAEAVIGEALLATLNAPLARSAAPVAWAACNALEALSSRDGARLWGGLAERDSTMRILVDVLRQHPQTPPLLQLPQAHWPPL